MKTLALTSDLHYWRAIVQEAQHTNEAIALELDGQVCGFVLPTLDARRLAAQYRRSETPQAQNQPAPQLDTLRTYLELLHDDPTLVPVEDGQALEFVTMMNSSYIDTQQIYQFRHPQTHDLSIYRASELQKAIGRTFAPVEFIPPHPRDVVQRKK
jgi:hypothetical protein